ncbi:MAG: phage shock protein operon transcriptional activator [Pseudomonadales bacterium]|nr:phage shock protein operon transcriptional activator [Pseudomonadales bacterium]MBO6702199.1 phage shock protein operon transcriptional activator [Pseudomonadales bacterium]MBO7006744.1 phage shock protein operon transcriptional activator [Pseudomonadales bacterium]
MNARQHNDRLLGESPAFLEVLDRVSQIAPLDKPVLIVGERGTGKELIAARLHYLSARWDQEYVKMNCAAISETLLETELFGHEAGAFTGASKMHRGRFERANRGSLFLDELATTSALVQEKLLRIIEYGEFERVGGSKTLTTDVRLIAATNEDLPKLADQGKFREDLLDRLAFDVITLPPLRARPEDIFLLAEHFAMNMASDLGLDFFPGFSEQALDKLSEYAWPGNIRELKNVVERSVYRSADEGEPVDVITLDPFESVFRPSVSKTRQADRATESKPAVEEAEFPIDFKQTVQEFEIELIQQALAASQFNQKKTAEALGVTYHQLRGYMKKYELFEND